MSRELVWDFNSNLVATVLEKNLWNIPISGNHRSILSWEGGEIVKGGGRMQSGVSVNLYNPTTHDNPPYKKF